MDIQDIAKKIAAMGLPLLGAALPLPGGAALGVALAQYIAAPGSSPEDILKHLTENAESVEKAKEFESNNQKEILLATMSHEQFMYQQDIADKTSARERDVEFLKVGKRNVRADVLAYGALVAFVLSGVALFFAQLPEDNRELLVYLLGALTVIVKDIYGFEFSSTRDSQNKTQLLAQAPAIQLPGKAA